MGTAHSTVPEIKRCTVGDCDRKYLARGMCQRHYDRLRRYGDLMLRGETATCTDCGITFNIATRGNPAKQCHDCRVERHRKRQRLSRWEKGLRENYGITADDYYEMFWQQEGRCAICKTDDVVGRGSKSGNWCVDHDHQTGEVRGLLCSRCNTGLGLFGDSPEQLVSAIKYLERNGKQLQGSDGLHRRSDPNSGLPSEVSEREAEAS